MSWVRLVHHDEDGFVLVEHGEVAGVDRACVEGLVARVGGVALGVFLNHGEDERRPLLG
jgi:hypothetical protein